MGGTAGTNNLKIPEWAIEQIGKGVSPEKLLMIAEKMPLEQLKKLNPALNGYLIMFTTIEEGKRSEIDTLVKNEKIKAVLCEKNVREKILD